MSTPYNLDARTEPIGHCVIATHTHTHTQTHTHTHTHERTHIACAPQCSFWTAQHTPQLGQQEGGTSHINIAVSSNTQFSRNTPVQ